VRQLQQGTLGVGALTENTGGTKYEPRRLTHVPPVQVPPKPVYHHESTGLLHTNVASEVTLWHRASDILETHAVLLFEVLQPPTSIREVNPKIVKKSGTYRPIAWGFLRLLGPDDDPLMGKRSVQLYEYDQKLCSWLPSCSGRHPIPAPGTTKNHHYQGSQVYPQLDAALRKSAKAIRALRMTASLKMETTLVPRTWPLPILTKAREGVRPVDLPAGLGGGEVGDDLAGHTALGCESPDK
jgi:hypothetical protein